VRNSAASLDACLSALRLSSFTDYECVVVDDCSTDASAAVALSHGFPALRMMRHSGPAAARNRGARAAASELLFFLDADVCVQPDTLERVWKALSSDAGLDAVMGSYDESPADPSLVSQFKNLLHHYIHQHGDWRAGTFWSACGGIRARVFREMGGFDENFRRPSVEDIDFGMRMRRSGKRLALDPRIQVKHLKRWSLANLVRTDVRDRALPWTRLILAEGRMPDDLNLRRGERRCVALSWMAALSVPACVWNPWSLALGGAAVLGVVFVQRRFYRFLAERRGREFAASAIPLHVLYFLYSGVGFGAGLIAHCFDRLRKALPGGSEKQAEAVARRAAAAPHTPPENTP
jgi:cellulose synthase/poly-beta-1,6-N-acetylglucosamine synthase-like glycosyltransferase